MAENLYNVELQVGPQGRIVIPASLRRAWNIKTGEIFLAHLENDRLVLERPEQVLQRIKARFANLRRQASLADELITERRNAAQHEETTLVGDA